MERITLNLIPKGITPICHASQYDTGRQIALDLMDDLQGYTLSDETIELGVCKPDGNIVTAAVEVTSGKTYVIIETTEQMTACEGDSECELKISKDETVIGTLNFKLRVERDPLKDGIESDTEIHNLTNQIHDINEEMIPAMVGEEVANQYDSQNVIFDDHPTAGHGIGYAVTSDGVATAVQDAKDYTDSAIGGLSIPENITDLDDVTITTPSNGEIMVYNNGSWENQANPSSTANFAPDYDDTATYNTNDKVIYQGLLYVCLEDSVTGAWDNTKWQQISVADYTAEMLPIESGSATNTKAYIDSGLSGKADKTELVKYFDLTANVQTADSGISPFSFYGNPTKTDSNIHNILSITVIDTQFNNPAIAVLYGQSGSTFTFMVYSARSGNVKIRVAYN